VRRAVLALAILAACRPASTPESDAPVDAMIVAPHPDDEVLIAAGVIERTRAAGGRVAVVVVTNGDYTCERDGNVREGETVDALALLGVSERDVHFLGYPDGYMAKLGDAPLAPEERRDRSGACVTATGTYASRGEGGADEHSRRTGAPAPYTIDAVEGDIAALLARMRPRDVYVTHPLDEHPDHAATYARLRGALERIDGPLPRIHRAIVHAGPCWPNGNGRTEPCPAVVAAPRAALAPLPAPYAAYAAPERVGVPNPEGKLAAIGRYRSQLGADPAHDWLVTFARAEEPFWPEELVRTGRARVDRAATGAVDAKTVSLGPAAREATAGAYTLRLDDEGGRLFVLRGDGPPLRGIVLPLDARDREHRFDVRIDPRADDRTIEVTLRRDGRLLAVVVDPT
jgi:LmbE family N-acetylglucosaminyl deacetylase